MKMHGGDFDGGLCKNFLKLSSIFNADMAKKEKNTGIYFLSLSIENLRCFKEKVTIDLSDGNNNWKQWTILLGDNGTGKSTVLEVFNDSQLINSQISSPIYKYLDLRLYTGGVGIFSTENRKINLGLSFEAKGNNPSQKLNITIGYNSATHGLDVDFTSNSFDITASFVLKVLCYGIRRTLLSPYLPYRSIDQKNPEEWLLELDYASYKESDTKQIAQRRKEEVIQLLLDILPDITDIRFSTSHFGRLDVKNSVEFLTPYGWVALEDLSQGYQTMIAWMVDLAYRLFERYPDSANPLAEPAVVLVDEIDLHLHPRWQRKIFDYLSEKFPRTQFIVTAHSPLVVQSAPADANIVLLRREGDHVVAEQDMGSVNTWRVDQILSSDLFGGIGARNPELENHLERRRALYSKKQLSATEKTELKQLDKLADSLPYAESKTDMEAKAIIREAADLLSGKNKNIESPIPAKPLKGKTVFKHKNKAFLVEEPSGTYSTIKKVKKAVAPKSKRMSK